MLDYRIEIAKHLKKELDIIGKKRYDEGDAMRAKSNDRLVLLVLILVGAILGSLIGKALGGTFPVLKYGESIGVDPFVVDLGVVVITFGFKLALNLAGIIGIILAFLLYRRL